MPQPAPLARGFVRSARALRALVEAHAAEPASPPRPPLNRRAVRTKGAAAPSLARADAPTSPASAGLCALSAGVHVRAGVARPDGCACGGTSPASAGLCALSAGVHVRAGVAGWSRWVAERSTIDATLWLLTHHDCIPLNLRLDIPLHHRYSSGVEQQTPATWYAHGISHNDHHDYHPGYDHRVESSWEGFRALTAHMR